MKLLLGVVLLGLGCTKPNPAVCCLDEADCTAAGIPPDRRCTGDLICIAHECQDPPVDYCVDNTACGAESPVCELSTNECRGCRSDSECDAGACSADGACAPESEIVYVSPTGNDGDCTRAEPCGILAHAVGKLAADRYRVVFAPGTYTPAQADGIITPPDIGTRVYFHGHGARISVVAAWPLALPVIEATVISLRELEIVRNASPIGCLVAQEVSLERVTLRGGGLSLNTTSPSNLEIAGALIVTSESPFAKDASALLTATIENLVVYGSAPLSLQNVTGTMSSSTIAWTGSASGMGAQGVVCTPSPEMTIKNSIIWTPNAGSLPPVSGCVLQNVISGPVAVAGATTVDPEFIDGAGGDVHLKPTSPARDAADEGPALDFEGDPRPQGPRFDIGADEAIP